MEGTMQSQDDRVHRPRTRRRLEIKVLEACRQLASEGGYQAVQMREVAKLAGVSLHTVYRYFPSKDDLVGATIEAQVIDLEKRINQNSPIQSSVSGRIGAVFLGGFHALMNDRGFAHASMHSYHVPKPFEEINERPPAEGEAEYNELTITDVAKRVTWGEDHETTEDQRMALRAMESVFNSCIIDWLNANITAEYVVQQLTFAAEKLFSEYTFPNEKDVAPKRQTDANRKYDNPANALAEVLSYAPQEVRQELARLLTAPEHQ
ncbi:TetR family transcriptional regulator [Rhodococcus erythropolis]|nr:TetR family transcriptional regulator [Rhodococcus erythropolis]